MNETTDGGATNRPRRFSRLRTRRAALAAGAVVVLGAGFGAGVAQAALSAPAPVLGFCRQSGTGDIHQLWLTGEGGTCPTGWSELTAFPGTGGPAGPAGPAGPQGPVGPAGVSAIAAHSGVSHSAAGTAGNGVVIVSVTGMPAYSPTAARRTFVDVNSEVLAGGVTVSLGAPVASPGSTTWNYSATVAGQVAATPAQTVSVDVLAWS